LKALPVSDPSRVLANAEPDTAYLTAIFGPEPEHNWCYYYEKANIAYHQQGWKQVLDFYKQAGDLGFKTKIGFELKPFVVANAKLGQWEQARDLTLLAFERDVTSKALYCSLWIDLVSSSPGPDVSNGSFTNVMDTLRCKQP
jgi:hypothetical protein